MALFGMAIDMTRCFGCQTCSVACKMANNLPSGMWFNRVETIGGIHPETPSGTFPNCSLSYAPISCQHCENAPCVAVCPTGATHVDERGIVIIDADTCIGCKSCIEACPYEVRTFVDDSFSHYLDISVGEFDAPGHKIGTVEKCTFCSNLLARGEEPACMQLCPGRARYWGDLDDPDSEISKAISGRKIKFCLEEEGTSPKVYYLQ